ncbi:major facilitator superfamily domain-containing protein [Protomyces lactucae-debilis]|uniref:Major facilitator superfamily domain-containing protein n=1 Tax=Protomyces lactucae-debilis TaxID=2754530 RepID=A0A1Y2F0D2_PROLT|nr:major facilitator superfamily domain-containing protein [Protomyces lactucae-debilis]ORY77342.1 major facilitator superfamily domain-containing protein [Protomyces lactucae-debilis]
MLDSMRPKAKRPDNAIRTIDSPDQIKPTAFASDESLDTRTSAQKYWTVVVCGIALLSDGYVASSIGTVLVILKHLYPEESKGSRGLQLLGSISFVGTVVGQLCFGYVTDRVGRKNGMLIATSLLILWTAMCAGAYGLNGSIPGLFAAITCYRAFLGFAIGAEYPTSSCAASETSAETPSGKRHFIFVLVTNTAIDMGFVLGAFVPYILVLILTANHLRAVWRMTIGLGVVVPLSLFYFRVKMHEPKAFKRMGGRNVKIPYTLILKRYWLKLAAISFIWFVYDFASYSFGLYSATITDAVLPAGSSYAKTFGWNTLLNVFYLPGSILGAYASDIIGPKRCLIIGLVLQATCGFFLAGFYEKILANGIAGFIVFYGIFLSLGEFGAGNSIGLLAAKSSSSMARGQYYAIAAAIGKIGAFVGSYAFPSIASRFSSTNAGYKGDFYVASAMAICAAMVAFFFVSELSQECIQQEDCDFVDYLQDNGFDISQLSRSSSLESQDGKVKELKE